MRSVRRSLRRCRVARERRSPRRPHPPRRPKQPAGGRDGGLLRQLRPSQPHGARRHPRAAARGARHREPERCPVVGRPRGGSLRAAAGPLVGVAAHGGKPHGDAPRGPEAQRGDDGRGPRHACGVLGLGRALAPGRRRPVPDGLSGARRARPHPRVLHAHQGRARGGPRHPAARPRASEGRRRGARAGAVRGHRALRAGGERPRLRGPVLA
ncbi:MAG: hypothetical protein ACK56F_09990, partial [bacterium]